MKARAEALKARRTAQAIRLKMRDLIGETILLADEAEDITPQERAAISGLLKRRKDEPPNWDLLADWLPPPPAHPAIVPDSVADAAE
jgi:hypothetical protein